MTIDSPSVPEGAAAGAPPDADNPRRAEALRVATRVIVRDGLEGASLRVIAREGGFTTGVLSHYFRDKRELLHACFTSTMRDWLDDTERQLASAADDDEHLRRFLVLAVPTVPERQDEWRIWAAMSTHAMRDPATAEVLVETDRRWESVVAHALRRWQAASLLRGDVPVRPTATVMVRLVDGLCLNALATGRWHDARDRLVHQLEMLGLPPDRAAAALVVPARDGR
jgi:AcrR family transcriptional regulator